MLIAGAFSALTAEAFEAPPVPEGLSEISVEEKEIYTDYFTPLIYQLSDLSEYATEEELEQINELLEFINLFLKQLYTDETYYA